MVNYIKKQIINTLNEILQLHEKLKLQHVSCGSDKKQADLYDTEHIAAHKTEQNVAQNVIHNAVQTDARNVTHNADNVAQTATDVMEQRLALLEACQQKAIEAGTRLEESTQSGNEAGTQQAADIVHILEQYCEELYIMSQHISQPAQQTDIQQPSQSAGFWGRVIDEDICRLSEYITSAISSVKNMPVTYRVVFLPYKVEMWDSLESIWRACSQDKRCECEVVPIPYFEYDANKQEWQPRYDGDRFPEYVHACSYEYYRLEEMHPDVAYVHNPYDDSNYVTSVHPAFYSSEIKKYVSKLVYVPYYVTSGPISPEHLDFPVHHNMDYEIVQSEYAKETCRGVFYYDKILPLGSPKLDSIIRLSKEGVEIPQEWRKTLEGKRKLMLNTSIGDFLHNNEALLIKLRALFNIVKRYDNIALIWRPHPLLEATIRSMRPQLATEYDRLKTDFISDGVGIYDNTPDISRIVAMSDGYIGSDGSSVMNLFGAAGKPIFILNYSFMSDPQDTEVTDRRIVRFNDIVKSENGLFGISAQYNVLFGINKAAAAVKHNSDNRLSVTPLCIFDKASEWTWPFAALSELNCKNIYIAPANADCPYLYNIETGKTAPLCDDTLENIVFTRAVCIGKSVFFTASNEFVIMEYNTGNMRWRCHTECMLYLWKDTPKANKWGLTYNAAAFRDSLWVVTGENNRLMQLDAKTGAYKIHTAGEDENRYTAIEADEREGCIWLGDRTTGKILRWGPDKAGIVSEELVPSGLNIWKDSAGMPYAFLKMYVTEKYILAVPVCSDAVVRFDKATGECTLLAQDFLAGAKAVHEGYRPGMASVVCASVMTDGSHLLIQRTYDGRIAVIDIEDGSITEEKALLSDRDFAKLTSGADGFEKINKDSYFACREGYLFTLESFLEQFGKDGYAGIKERQLKALSTLAANLDGTCGEKVHEYMMQCLTQEEY